MFFRLKTFYLLKKLLVHATWRGLIAAYLSHAIATFALLRYAGEGLADSLINFMYWYVVMGSSVGFGDEVVKTDMGKLITTFFAIPIGLMLFTVLVGKVIQVYVEVKSKIMKGQIDIKNEKNHVLIFGWHSSSTPKLIKTIFSDTKREDRHVVIVSDEVGLEHPLPNSNTSFISVDSFYDDKELSRLSIQGAFSIIVNTGSDDKNIVTCLKLHKLTAAHQHIVTYIKETDAGRVLEEACSNVECVFNPKEEIMVRAMQDSGTATINESINNPGHNATQYMLALPDNLEIITYHLLRDHLQAHHDMTIMGYAEAEDHIGRNLILNPRRDALIRGGMKLFYIANERLSCADINWNIADIEPLPNP